MPNADERATLGVTNKSDPFSKWVVLAPSRESRRKWCEKLISHRQKKYIANTRPDCLVGPSNPLSRTVFGQVDKGWPPFWQVWMHGGSK